LTTEYTGAIRFKRPTCPLAPCEKKVAPHPNLGGGGPGDERAVSTLCTRRSSYRRSRNDEDKPVGLSARDTRSSDLSLRRRTKASRIEFATRSSAPRTADKRRHLLRTEGRCTLRSAPQVGLLSNAAQLGDLLTRSAVAVRGTAVAHFKSFRDTPAESSDHYAACLLYDDAP